MQPVKISQFTINDLIRQCTQAKTELSTLSQKISDLAGDMSVLKRSDASLMGQEIHGISSEQIEAMRKKYDCRTDSECLLAIQKQIEECSEHIKPLCDSVHAAKIVASKAIKETLSQTIPTKTKAARNTGKRTKIALLTTEIEEASSLGESLSKKVSEILSQKHKNPLPQDILTSEPPKKKPKTDLSSSQEHSSYEKITESFKRLHEAHSLLQQSKGGPKETASMSNYAAERRRFQQEIEVLRPSLNQPFVNKITQDAEELHMSAQRLHPQIPEPPRPVTEQPPPPSASSSNIRGMSEFKRNTQEEEEERLAKIRFEPYRQDAEKTRKMTKEEAVENRALQRDLAKQSLSAATISSYAGIGSIFAGPVIYSGLASGDSVGAALGAGASWFFPAVLAADTVKKFSSEWDGYDRAEAVICGTTASFTGNPLITAAAANIGGRFGGPYLRKAIHYTPDLLRKGRQGTGSALSSIHRSSMSAKTVIGTGAKRVYRETRPLLGKIHTASVHLGVGLKNRTGKLSKTALQAIKGLVLPQASAQPPDASQKKPAMEIV